MRTRAAAFAHERWLNKRVVCPHFGLRRTSRSTRPRVGDQYNLTTFHTRPGRWPGASSRRGTVQHPRCDPSVPWAFACHQLPCIDAASFIATSSLTKCASGRRRTLRHSISRRRRVRFRGRGAEPRDARGHPSFLAPELFERGTFATSDLYALGVTIYLLTGRCPYGEIETISRLRGLVNNAAVTVAAGMPWLVRKHSPARARDRSGTTL